MGRTPEEMFQASRDLVELTALVQGASQPKTKNQDATGYDERVAIGSTALNRLDYSGTDREGFNENFGNTLHDVLYNPKSEYYEFNGKNERANEVLNNKVSKYNEKEFKQSLAIASGLLKGTIPRKEGLFILKSEETPALKEGLDKVDTYGVHETWNIKQQKKNQQYSTGTPVASYTGNIDLAKRPIVNNKDGSISTERSMSFNLDGKEVLIPTIINGKKVSQEKAIAHFKKTGENLGMFDTPEEATAMALKIHERGYKKNK